MKTGSASVEARWTRAGALLNIAPARAEPDIERLLTETPEAARSNPRLFGLAAAWLVERGCLVARHRLGLLAAALPRESSAVLGLLLETAISRGASRGLASCQRACRRLEPGQPLFDVYREHARLEALARQTASPESIRWGVWAPPIEPAFKSLRPLGWILEHNPGFRDRLLRGGDLRCSIVAALRHDAGGRARSEAEVARLAGATRAAVRKALASLVREGEVELLPRAENRRDCAVVLREAA